MKVYSARSKYSTKPRQRTRSLDGVESFFERSILTQKTTSAKSTRSIPLRKEYISNPSLQKCKQTNSEDAALQDIATFRTQSHIRRVKFSEDYSSWYNPNICTRHLVRSSEAKDKTAALKERGYCEVLGNRFCKACSKINARKECEGDFESTYLNPKSQQFETRSMTPLSDIVLCKSPPLPQSDSRGLFVRLHEFQSLPPQYYINPMEGIYSNKELGDDVACRYQPKTIDSGKPNKPNDEDNYASLKHTEMKESCNDQVQKCGIEETTSEIDKQRVTNRPSRTSFKTVMSIALATIPMRKSNTFLPELHLKDINRQIKHILKDSETRNAEKGYQRRESFKDMPIEPPQITVNFALGIYDPKKRKLKKTVNYSAKMRNSLLNKK